MKKFYIIVFVVAVASICAIQFWQKTLEPTSMQIKDPIRHYFPIVQGDELSITCEITNTGNSDLSITDIQPSNFSISMDTSMPGIIPRGKSEILHFTFHSEKNLGLTTHIIRFFGNIAGCDYDSLVFDTHIVRPTIDGSDYEEVYFRNKRDAFDVLIDGDLGQKNYWTDNDTDADSSYIHTYKNELYIDY